MNGLPQMATIKETAECLRCSESLIEKMLDEGLLRSVKRPSPYNPLATRSLRVLIFVDSVHKLLGMSPKRQPSNASLEAEARAAGERMGWGDVEPGDGVLR